MNEGENSSMPQKDNFSSPNISSDTSMDQQNTAIATPQVITSSDISAMASTNAGAVMAAAAALPENDTPVAVNSGDSLDMNAKKTRARFNFGMHRYRNDKTVAQNNISFSGAPSYFQEAANDIAYESYVEKKSKKPLIIGISVAVAVLIAVIIVVTIMPKATNSADEIASLRELTNDSYSSVSYFEDMIKMAKLGIHRFSAEAITEDQYKATKEESANNLAKVKEFREKLNSQNNIKTIDEGTSESIQGQVDSLKKILDSRMPVYEKYASITSAMYHIYYTHASDEAINDLKASYDSDSVREIAGITKNYYAKHTEYSKNHYANGCNNHPNTATCLAITQSILNLTDAYTQDKTLNNVMLGLVPKSIIEEDPLKNMDIIINANRRENENEKE